MDDSTTYQRVTHNIYLNLYLTYALKSDGWILSKNDYETFQQAYGDDFVCYVAFDGESKQFYGTVWGLFHRDINNHITLFSIASFYVLPLYRGKGIGKKLFEIIINHAESHKSGINMYLTSVDNMREKYCNYGFNLERDSFIKIYTPLLEDFNIDNISNVSCVILKKYHEIEDWDKIFEYDRKFTTNQIDRSKFLKLLFTRGDGYGYIGCDKDDNVVGFIHIRECLSNNLDIGPFYADKPEIAKNLLTSVIKEIKLGGKKYSHVLIKVFSRNNEAQNLLKDILGEKAICNENMYGKFTKAVIPTKEELVYSMSDYTLSQI